MAKMSSNRHLAPFASFYVDCTAFAVHFVTYESFRSKLPLFYLFTIRILQENAQIVILRKRKTSFHRKNGNWLDYGLVRR